MKPTPFLAMLASLLLLNCQPGSPDVSPRHDALFGRWRLTQTRIGNRPWQRFPDLSRDLEYRRNGTIVHRNNNVVDASPCCQPTRFSRRRSALRYTAHQRCPLALCGLVQEATISRLSPDELVLVTDNVVTHYRAVR